MRRAPPIVEFVKLNFITSYTRNRTEHFKSNLVALKIFIRVQWKPRIDREKSINDLENEKSGVESYNILIYS